jgi:very-short-patch-repair endonuclease
LRAGRSGTLRAQELRGTLTEAEQRLWSRLRRRQLGYAFRRQHPIPPYTVDFACTAKRLVIEADGGQHAESKSDARRDGFLRRQGWTVLRFWNNDVLQNTDGVIEAISAYLDLAPTQPSPVNGGGLLARDRVLSPPPTKGRES